MRRTVEEFKQFSKTSSGEDGVIAEDLQSWFADRGWNALEFQREVWDAYLAGNDGLIHSATGTGKTLAAWLGPLSEWISENSHRETGPRILWITPLRALAADTAAALSEPLVHLGIPWRVETRTGDTSASVRARQKISLPEALVTTPESISLMFTRQGWSEQFRDLKCIVVDEWHELVSTKRGVQTELAIARIRSVAPNVRIWGVSATLGNLPEAMSALLGPERAAHGVLVSGNMTKEIVVDSILPEEIERFPWAGHLGDQMVSRVAEQLDSGGTSLIFCNTRSQTEIWHRALLELRPAWVNEIGLHHGSVDRGKREQVEAGLKSGALRAVVCTSSLDLGVDFSPVDRVFQVGSPKGVARLLQKAGRSGHRPGLPSRVTCVPTHSLELIDIAAARTAVRLGRIESREDLERPLDVLVQHLVTLALGDGFLEEDLAGEVRSTHAYRKLTPEEWGWCLEFITTGGSTLKGYDEYRRVVEVGGRYLVRDKRIADRHRMSIGTIVSDSAMVVKYLTGQPLGSVEESFLARLKPGDKFVFAGRALEFVRIKDMTAWVRRAANSKGSVPRWMGSRLPLSSELALSIREQLDLASNGVVEQREMEAILPLLNLQRKWSAIPKLDEVLIERVETREGHHIFLYPFEGRLVHEGMAAVLALRIARIVPITFSLAANDYGIELLSPDPAPLDQAIDHGLFGPEALSKDISESLNAVELARRQFREIARVAGLIFEGYPSARKSAKQLQGSSGLFFDVFLRYDPENRLLTQARTEVLERQLQEGRMARALARMNASRLVMTNPKKPTPLSFPILVDRLRQTLSTESVPDRIQKLRISLESAAGSAR